MWGLRQRQGHYHDANVWTALSPKHLKIRVSQWTSLHEQSKPIASFDFYDWCILLQNFSICSKCCRLGQLFHKLHHQKHRMFSACSEVVESRKKNTPNIDTTRMLNELLADDGWLESVGSTFYVWQWWLNFDFIPTAISENARFVGRCGYLCSVNFTNMDEIPQSKCDPCLQTNSRFSLSHNQQTMYNIILLSRKQDLVKFLQKWHNFLEIIFRTE